MGSRNAFDINQGEISAFGKGMKTIGVFRRGQISRQADGKMFASDIGRGEQGEAEEAQAPAISLAAILYGQMYTSIQPDKWRAPRPPPGDIHQNRILGMSFPWPRQTFGKGDVKFALVTGARPDDSEEHPPPLLMVDQRCLGAGDIR